MSNYYLKLRFNVLNDPVIATLPDNLWRRYFELYMSAKYVNNCGSFQPTDELAFHLRDDKDVIEKEIDELRKLGLIHPSKNMIARYRDEQDAFTDAERKEQQRERERDTTSHKPVTKRDANRDYSRKKESKKVLKSNLIVKSSRSRKTKSAAASTVTLLTTKGGISNGVAQELSVLDHVSPEYIAAMIWTWKKKKNPTTGLLVKMIRDADIPLYSDYANRPKDDDETDGEYTERLVNSFKANDKYRQSKYKENYK